MTDIEKALQVAANLRAQANQIDHVDEEEDLLDLASLLERLTAAARPPIVGDAPHEVHAALNLIWSSVKYTDGGGALTLDEDDNDVLEVLKRLDADALFRAGFVLAMARSLVMIARTA